MPPRSERRAQTRQRMVDAAIAVVADRGFDGASVDAIAAEAGFSIGALYGNFDGKDGLFLAVYDAHAAWFEETVGALDVGADADALVAALLATVDGAREQFLVFVDFWAYAVRRPELRDALAERLAALRAVVAGRLEERERATGRPLPLPPDTLAVLLLAAWRGLAIERLADRDAVAAEAIGPVIAPLLG